MIASQATAPTIEPITVEELMLYLKMDDETGIENDILNELIKTARIDVENDSRRAIITQKWDYYLDNFPDTDAFKLPFGNLQTTDGDIEYIKYTNSSGTQTTMTITTDYLVETNGDQCGRIVLPYGVSWPSFTSYPSNPIVIRFICGYGDASSDVPATVKSAIKRRCALLYFNRGSSDDIIDKTYNQLINNIPRLHEEF